MPFFKNIQNKFGLIAVWKLTENWEELLPLVRLTEADKKRFDLIHSVKRRAEFLSTRILLRRTLGEHESIDYTSIGKPVLQNSQKHISISHSADFACIFIAEQRVGIDIELGKRNIERVADRFLHIEEKKHLAELPDPQLGKITYWSAKEAIFKCSDAHGIRFNEQIRVQNFSPENNAEFLAKLLLPGHTSVYRLKTHLFENNVMVFCVEQ